MFGEVRLLGPLGSYKQLISLALCQHVITEDITCWHGCVFIVAAKSGTIK